MKTKGMNTFRNYSVVNCLGISFTIARKDEKEETVHLFRRIKVIVLKDIIVIKIETSVCVSFTYSDTNGRRSTRQLQATTSHRSSLDRLTI